MTKNTTSKNSVFIRELYDNSNRELFAFLLRRSSNKQQAQDLSQEAYLRLIRVERTDLIEQPKAYLFRIAANLVHEMRIKGARNAEKKTYPFEEVEDIPSTDEPHLNYETAQAITDLDKIIEDLPLMYQTVLLMRKRDGLNHIDIANKLGISIHTVRKYLTRAVAECRKVHSMGGPI